MQSMSMFNWRILIFRSELPANAKYIACYLSTFMNEWGDNCYPSTKRISHETGLSEPTVCKYLQILRDENWLLSNQKRFQGRAWAHNQYYPNIPDKALKEVKHVEEGTKTGDLRHLNSEAKALKELKSNSTVNSTDNSTNYMSNAKRVDVPYQSIIDLYHEILPDNPSVAKLSKARKVQIKARWKDGIEDLEAWKRYFKYVAKSKFLTGKTEPGYGREIPFVATIDFLIKEANVLKIVEGKYHGKS